MRFARYLSLTLIGSTVWCLALAAIGLGVGTGYERFHRAFRFVDLAVLAAAVGVLSLLLLRRLRATRSLSK